MKHFTKLYNDKILGAMNGWDRIRLRGTIRWLASTRGLATYLGTRGIHVTSRYSGILMMTFRDQHPGRRCVKESVTSIAEPKSAKPVITAILNTWGCRRIQKPLNKPLAIFVPVSKRRGKLIVLLPLGL